MPECAPLAPSSLKIRVKSFFPAPSTRERKRTANTPSSAGSRSIRSRKPMMDFFTDEMRRNPSPIYDQIRSTSPLFHIPPPFDAWAIFDYDGAKRALNDHE